MKISLIALVVLGLALTAAVSAQDSNPTPPASQAPAPGADPNGWQGMDWRAGASGRWANTGMGGRGVEGTVTSVAPSFYMVKTEAGESYKVSFSANTRILKQAIQKRGEGGANGETAHGSERGERGNRQRSAPEAIKPTDIKTGDEVAALGEVDPTARSVGALIVMQIDPERAKMMHEQKANFGKTWLMGKVTAINETTVSLLGALDNAAHDIKADENTTFRKRRVPITLADIQVGDMLRVEGAVKGGSFMATSVSVMGMPQGGPPSVPGDAAPAPATPPSAPAPNAPQQK